MPLVILVFAVIILFSAINNKLSDLSALVKEDWQPSKGVSFGVWLLAIVVIGVIGYYKPLKAFSNTFLVLVFVAIIISNKGFYSQFASAFNFKFAATPGTNSTTGGGSGNQSSASNILSGFVSSPGNIFSNVAALNGAPATSVDNFLSPLTNAATDLLAP